MCCECDKIRHSTKYLGKGPRELKESTNSCIQTLFSVKVSFRTAYSPLHEIHSSRRLFELQSEGKPLDRSPRYLSWPSRRPLNRCWWPEDAERGSPAAQIIGLQTQNTNRTEIAARIFYFVEVWHPCFNRTELVHKSHVKSVEHSVSDLESMRLMKSQESVFMPKHSGTTGGLCSLKEPASTNGRCDAALIYDKEKRNCLKTWWNMSSNPGWLPHTICARRAVRRICVFYFVSFLQRTAHYVGPHLGRKFQFLFILSYCVLYIGPILRLYRCGMARSYELNWRWSGCTRKMMQKALLYPEPSAEKLNAPVHDLSSNSRHLGI